MSQKVLSFDLGGTKIAAGIVTQRGKVLHEIRVPIALEKGKHAVLNQMIEMGNLLLTQHPEVTKVGLASAGPLHAEKGLLLNPINFVRNGKSWGIVPITSHLNKAFKREVFLENDAAAAILAEQWIGAARGQKNAMVLTLGTGLGTGIICNGDLVISGHKMHTEAGHIIIRSGDESALCGCGNYGCAEAFLSGKNFEKRAGIRFKKPSISASQVATLAREGNRRALEAFEEYSELMSAALYSYMRMFNPDVIVFAGSFANAADLFLERTEQLLFKKLRAAKSSSTNVVPKLKVSPLENNSGLIGAAVVALRNPAS